MSASNKQSINESLLVQKIRTNIGVVIVAELKNQEKFRITYSKRELQKIVSRILVEEEIEGCIEISRNKNGAPFISCKSFNEISISHSSNFYCVFLSRTESVGVDIEAIRIIRQEGISYFINENEVQKWNNEELLAIWGAKESLYKKFKGRINDLRVDATTKEVSDFVLLEYKGNEYSFNVIQNEKYTLVYG